MPEGPDARTSQPRSLVRAADRFLSARSSTFIVAAGVLLVALLGGVNAQITQEVSFSVFYILPIGLVAWYAGYWPGLALSGLAAATWLAASYLPAEPASAVWIPYWNSVVRLGFFVTVAVLLSTLRGAFEREQAAARSDPLTGLLRAPPFLQATTREIVRARRYGRGFTLAYLDADNFKTVNDAHGHAAGDRVLATIGGIVRRELRAVDVGARIGGDEFAVLLPETDRSRAEAALAKLQRALMAGMHAGGWPVTFSIGAVACAETRDRADDLLHQADAVMYAAKQAGKNRVLIREVS